MRYQVAAKGSQKAAAQYSILSHMVPDSVPVRA